MSDTAKIVLFSLVVLDFFGLFGIRCVSYAIHLVFIANFINKVWMKREVPLYFSLPFSLILIGFACSIVSSVVYEDSSVWKLFSGGRFLLSVFYLFFIELFQPDRKDVEQALVILSIMMCSFYIIQFVCMMFGVSLLPTKIDLEDVETTDIRMRMRGSALSAFAYFYGFCKLWNKEGRTGVNIALVVLGATVILLMSFRTMIAALAIVTVYLAIRNSDETSPLLNKVLIGVIPLLLAATLPVVQDKFDYMIEKQMSGSATFLNKDYVRWQNLAFHYNGFFHDNVEYFFGSGIAAKNGTLYAAKLAFANSSHYMWVDWGLLGLSWMVGIITVIGILLYVWRVLKINYDRTDSYVFAFFLYLILVSITTNEFARSGNFVVQALVLYLAYDIYCEQNYDCIG